MERTSVFYLGRPPPSLAGHAAAATRPRSLQQFFLCPSPPSTFLPSFPHFPSFSPVVSHMSALGAVNISPAVRGRPSFGAHGGGGGGGTVCHGRSGKGEEVRP